LEKNIILSFFLQTKGEKLMKITLQKKVVICGHGKLFSMTIKKMKVEISNQSSSNNNT